MMAFTIVLLLFFSLVTVTAHYTGKNADNNTFYQANKKAPWYLIAFSMIGTSLSGVTYISLPGWVASTQFSYLQVVLGYFLGYSFIAIVLLPLYYRLKLISIYGYLAERMGRMSHKTGAVLFLISRFIGASFRLYLVINIVQLVFFRNTAISFYLVGAISIILMLAYTMKGGLRTIIWTDALQTSFILVSLFTVLYLLIHQINLSPFGVFHALYHSHDTQIFQFSSVKNSHYFFKDILSGMFIIIVMTGLDQDMMQKNLSCRTLGDAKKNIYTYSVIYIFVNLLFLVLGALLLLYAQQKHIHLPSQTDYIFPLIATKHLGEVSALMFFFGLISAAYSTADSAMTALTTSICVDILGHPSDTRLRKKVHFAVAGMLFLLVVFYKQLNSGSVINEIFTLAGYTYGPLLGLFAFGMLSKKVVRDHLSPLICLFSPCLCYLIKCWAQSKYGYHFGFELLMLNGLLTYIGLALCAHDPMPEASPISC